MNSAIRNGVANLRVDEIMDCHSPKGLRNDGDKVKKSLKTKVKEAILNAQAAQVKQESQKGIARAI